jgi:hypothetical protein
MERMQMLEDALGLISNYTKVIPWRPGLVDLWVYNIIIDMYDNDHEEENLEYIWKDTPDAIMESLISGPVIFDMEYGFEDLDEQVREYLINEEFIVSVDDVTEEEYNTYKEGIAK